MQSHENLRAPSESPTEEVRNQTLYHNSSVPQLQVCHRDTNMVTLSAFGLDYQWTRDVAPSWQAITQGCSNS